MATIACSRRVRRQVRRTQRPGDRRVRHFDDDEIEVALAVGCAAPDDQDRG
jgi:hypothetical protein